jgi:hypothetical protein
VHTEVSHAILGFVTTTLASLPEPHAIATTALYVQNPSLPLTPLLSFGVLLRLGTVPATLHPALLPFVAPKGKASAPAARLALMLACGVTVHGASAAESLAVGTPPH